MPIAPSVCAFTSRQLSRRASLQAVPSDDHQYARVHSASIAEGLQLFLCCPSCEARNMHAELSDGQPAHLLLSCPFCLLSYEVGKTADTTTNTLAHFLAVNYQHISATCVALQMAPPPHDKFFASLPAVEDELEAAMKWSIDKALQEARVLAEEAAANHEKGQEDDRPGVKIINGARFHCFHGTIDCGWGGKLFSTALFSSIACSFPIAASKYPAKYFSLISLVLRS